MRDASCLPHLSNGPERRSVEPTPTPPASALPARTPLHPRPAADPQWHLLSPPGRLRLEIVPRFAGQRGFQVLSKRWIVERTLAWLVKRRRLGRHYEQRPDHSEGFIYLTMISLMLKRLAKSQPAI